MIRRPGAARSCTRRREELVRPRPRQRLGCGVLRLLLLPGDPGVPPRVTVEEEYLRGNPIGASDLPHKHYLPGHWIATVEASYFGEECLVAGRIRRVQVEGEQVEVVITPSGTQSEALLRYATGVGHPEVRLHLCQADCAGLRTSPDLVRVKQLRKLDEGKDYLWEVNLGEADLTQGLRGEQEQWQRGKDKEKEVVKSSSSSGKDKKKSRKKKKKKDKSSRKEKVKVGGRAIAQKSLETVFQGAGLDPNHGNRKKVMKKLIKQLRRNKSDSSSTSTGSESEDEEDFKQDFLTDKNKVHRVAALAPGVLAATSIGKMKEFVLQSTGSSWRLDDTTLPPVMSQYVRTFLSQKASGGILREMTTVSYTADLLLQGRIAEGLDVLAQRLKSLEVAVSGQSWTAGQRIELAPALEASIMSRSELQLAQKENQAELKVRAGSNTWEKGKSQGKGKDRNKGKEKNPKGKGKEEGKKQG